MWWRGWSLGAMLAFGLAALRCSAFGSDDTPAAESDASTPEGGDGMAAGDASSDAAQAGDALDCSSASALCDDFERDGPPFDKRWSSENGKASRVISSALGSQSPSRALVITQVDGGGGDDFYQLTKNFPGPHSRLHCSFSCFVDVSPDGTDGTPIEAMLNAGPDGGAYSLQLDIRPASDSRDTTIERGFGLSNVAYPPLGAKIWHKIEFEIPKLRLWYNGIETPVPASQQDNISGPFGSASVNLGLVTRSPNRGWRIAIDDVVCTFQ
jgi:hypothetical protein